MNYPFLMSIIAFSFSLLPAQDYWKHTNMPFNGVIRSVTVDSNGSIFAAAYGGGVFYSSDNGENWSPKNNGLTALDVNCIAVNSSSHLFAGTYGGGIFKSTDSGENWYQINSGLPIGASTQIYSVMVNLNDYVYAAVYDLTMQEGGIYRSLNYGDEWSKADSGLIDKEVHCLIHDPYNILYAGTIDGAFISMDNGETWTVLHPDLPDVSSIAIAYGNIFIATWDGGIFRSTDFGTTWTSNNDGLTTLNVSSLVVNSAGRIFAGTFGGGVFQSVNNGNNWNEINDGLTTVSITSLMMNHNDFIFAGSLNNGIFRSTNRTVYFWGLLGRQFSSFIERVNTVPESERSAVVDSFMNTVPSFPLIEDSVVVYFIYRGNSTSVNIPGDANGWEPSSFPMTQVQSTNLWYYEAVFEADARLDYKFITNGGTWILDPLNPNKISGGFGPNSELAMPAYVQPEEINFNSDIKHGTFYNSLFASTHLGNSRNIRIYTPPDYNTYADSLPIVLFHDGIEYTTLGSAGNIIDNLIAENLIQPFIGIFVPPVDRDNEYAFDQTALYESFIVDELIPFIDSTYRTKKDPHYRAMIGLSWGGLITAQICYNHPEIFGLAGLFSPSFWPKDMEVFNTILAGFKKNIKWYIDWGTYEFSIMYNAIPFKEGLILNGYELEWYEWHEGHSWGSWRAHLDNTLTYFFPAAPADAESEPNIVKEYLLYQNYPNPFNPVTRFRFRVSQKELVSLKIYDLMGNETATIVDEELAAGTYNYQWNAGRLASGVYFYRLRGGNFQDTKKLILLK